MGVRAENVICGFTNDFEIAVGKDFIRIETDAADKLAESSLDGGFGEILEAENSFEACFSIDEEEGIVNASYGTTIAINDVVVPNLAWARWSGDWVLI